MAAVPVQSAKAYIQYGIWETAVFEYYMEDPQARGQMDWSDQPNYPRPDYLSSSRKRLAPQSLFKGGILHSWRRKCAVALNKSFYDTLP